MAGYKDEDWLKRAYYEEDRALSDIAEEFGVTIEAVRYYMKKYDLPRRRRGAREGEKNPAWKGGKQTLTCENCGREYQTTYWKAKNDLSKYCSDKCKHEDLSERYSGKGNHQYGVRGKENSTYGRTGEDHPMYGIRGPEHPNWAGGQEWRDQYEWRQTRVDVLERDGYECVECGRSNSESVEEFGQELHAHHITPVSDGGEKFDMGNLEALCPGCHSQKHNDNGLSDTHKGA